MKNILFYIVIFLLLIVLGFLFKGNFTNKDEIKKVTIVAMLDISGSTTGAKGIREQWYSEIEQALKPFSDDNSGNINFSRAVSITIGSITDNTAASGSIIQRNIEKSKGMMGVHSEEKETRQKAINECLAYTKKTIYGNASASDIMSAMNRVGKYFSTGDDSTKILLVFSDMIEQTPRYNFDGEKLTSTRIKQIIEKEKSDNRLPNLKGVKVWISGFAAADNKGLSPNKIQTIQDFWIAYFKATGADIDSSRIDRSLNNFTIPEK